MTTVKVPRRTVVADLAAILESPEISGLIAELEATRWTGRPGYLVRSLVGVALAKSMYAIPTWTRVVALVHEHPALADVIALDGELPSVYACYRFTGKLRQYRALLDSCIEKVLRRVVEERAGIGKHVAIDATDMPAYANGQRFVSKGGRERSDSEFSDPDASWGHRSAVSTRKGGGFYGYRLHMAVCTETEIPLAWTVETAKKNEVLTVEPLLEKLQKIVTEQESCAMDKGYDLSTAYNACVARNIAPIIPLRQTPDVKRGAHEPPRCVHGEWRFAGADRKRNATKWRCPSGECKPASVWVKADRLHPIIPRETLRWRGLYKKRGAVERQFGRLKNEWGLAPLRIRGLDRVRLHVDLTVLAQLSCALARAQLVEVQSAA